MRRLVLEAAEDDAAEGSGWLELQVDPTSYAPFVGGITPALEIVLDAAREASRRPASGWRSSSPRAAPGTRWTRARSRAWRHGTPGRPGEVVGFGLSNDERRGSTADFAARLRHRPPGRAGPRPARRRAARRRPRRARSTTLRPDRLGHGVRGAEDPACSAALVDAGVASRCARASNVSLGVYPDPGRRAAAAAARRRGPGRARRGRPAAVRQRLVDQYTAAREVHGLDDAALADLARAGIRASRAPSDVQGSLLAGVAAWLAAPA